MMVARRRRHEHAISFEFAFVFLVFTSLFYLWFCDMRVTSGPVFCSRNVWRIRRGGPGLYSLRSPGLKARPSGNDPFRE